MKSIKSDFSLMKRLPFSVSPSDVPFEYTLGDKRYRGIPEEFSPSIARERVDSRITETVIIGHTPQGLLLRAECREYSDYPVAEWVMYITNESEHDSAIISDWQLSSAFGGCNPRLYHGNGDNITMEGYEWYTDEVKAEPLRITPCDDGTPCNGAFPYMRLIFDDWCLNIAVGWSGTWALTAALEENDVIITASQATFRTYLRRDETVRTPRVTLQAVSGGQERARNLWRSYYFDHIIPRENGQPLPPKLVLHTWMIDGLPEFCGITEENQLLAIDTYIKGGMKPDIWWIDAGWYPCNNDWPFTGSWYANPKTLPNGMTAIGEKTDAEGIQLLVWFEPERVRCGSDIWNEHPEFLLYYKKQDNPWLQDNALYNLGNKQACDWMIDTVDALIKKWHIRIYRQDFNFAPGFYWAQNTEPDREGILENLHIQGYYRYWDALIDRNPGLWIDSCASGGRRNDPETMRRAVPLHYTDMGYGNHPTKQKQHREMFEWIPYFRAHSMNWDEPDGSYGGTSHTIDDFAYQNALAPAMTSMLEWNASEELYALSRRFVPIWRKAAELELSCDYYPLTECRADSSDWYAMQFDGGDKGFIQIIRNVKVKSDCITLNNIHVDTDKTYTFTDFLGHRSFSISGKELSEVGFTDKLPPRSGVIWFYTTR